jgi:hypothetical protein
LDGTVALAFKFLEQGLFNIEIGFEDLRLKNGAFQLLVVSQAVDLQVKVAVTSGVCMFDAEKLSNPDFTATVPPALPVKLILRQRQLVVNHHFGPLNLKIFSRRIINSRVRPRLKIRVDPTAPNQITVRDAAISLVHKLRFNSMEERNIFFYTFNKFLQMNIGCSAEAFADKKAYFEAQLKIAHQGMHVPASKLRLNVQRSKLLETTYHRLTNEWLPNDFKHWRRNLHIVFEGEEGIDSGGLYREFFQLISKEIFFPSSIGGCGMFCNLESRGKTSLVHPNRHWREHMTPCK